MLPTTTVPKGPATLLSGLMTLLYLAGAFISAARDNPILNIDPRILAIGALIIAGAAAAGRTYQAIRGSVPVAWGLSSGFLFAGVVVSALLAALNDVLPAWADAGLSTNALVVISGGLTVLFSAIRQIQSGALGSMFGSGELTDPASSAEVNAPV